MIMGRKTIAGGKAAQFSKVLWVYISFFWVRFYSLRASISSASCIKIGGFFFVRSFFPSFSCTKYRYPFKLSDRQDGYLPYLI